MQEVVNARPLMADATISSRVRALNQAALLAIYAAVLLAPLLLIVRVAKPGAHDVLVVFADALGFAAMSLLSLQVFSSGRWAATTRPFGLRRVLSLHRQAGIAALVLVVAHVVILFADDPARLALLDVASAPGRARAGVAALLGLLGLAGTSVWRRQVRLRYEQWRAVHLALTVVVIGGAFVHIMWVDSYSAAGVVRWSVLGLVVGAAVAMFWSRVAAPYASAGRPYRVLGVRRERGDAVTLELAADGHRGLRFAPGQFARLRLADRPFGIDDHPFTLSSSAQRPSRPAFTVKALGDFSASLAELPIGSEVLVEGPHGEGLHDQRAGAGRLLIAAGIGITPAVSVLRTAVERHDRQRLLLLYGSRSWADVTFREELDDLGRTLPHLKTVHVLSRPETGWDGQRGRISARLLRDVAPRDIAAWTALVCGPPRMVTDVVFALRGLGMPSSSIQAEGFE
jgi:predicted ferric reductase